MSDGEDDITSPVLTSELDLHTFVPQECAELVEEYLHAAQDAGMMRVRIIHGKGTGTLRTITHAVLDRHAAVERYHLGDETSGGWGATLVDLKPKV
jgi:dsDNA-specific endonuclease/ATPase MutS2